MSLNHIWRTEQLEARLRGYDDEHDGNRIAVNRVRATGGINSSREYILTEVETGEEVFVSDAAEFEARYKLTPTIISRQRTPTSNKGTSRWTIPSLRQGMLIKGTSYPKGISVFFLRGNRCAIWRIGSVLLT